MPLRRAASLMVSTAMPAGPPSVTIWTGGTFSKPIRSVRRGMAGVRNAKYQSPIAAISPADTRTGAARFSLPEIEGKLASPFHLARTPARKGRVYTRYARFVPGPPVVFSDCAVLRDVAAPEASLDWFPHPDI